MKCIEARENLSLYMDNMLEQDQMEQIRIHLEACDACRNEYEQLSMMKQLLAEIQDVPLPEAFDGRLRSALLATKTIQLNNKKKIKMFSAVAAVFVIGIFSFAMYNNMEELIPQADQFSTINEMTDIQEYAGEPASEPETGEPYAVLDSENTQNTERKQTAQAVNDGAGLPKEQEAALEQPFSTLPESTAPMEEISRHLDSISTEQALQIATDLHISGSAIAGSRDSAAILHYAKLIQYELSEFDYKITGYWEEAGGIWCFEVEISTVDEYSADVVEKYIYSGKDGAIWKRELL